MHTVVVAVTEPAYRKAEHVFEQAQSEGLRCIACPPDEAELAAAIRRHGARHAILSANRYTKDLYEAIPKGGVLARFGVGYDGVDLALATEMGLFCTNTPGVLDDSVAEFTLAMVLAAARHLSDQIEDTRRGGWEPKIGFELRGKRLAVIGCGPIGRHVARIASFGFGMVVVGCEILDVDAETMKREYGFAEMTPDFPQAVADADFVSLHIPSTAQTRHFINRQRLAAIPERAWLVNMARGAVVNEADLFDALRAGRIRGAALDVFDVEPYAPVDPQKDLRRLDNVIMTPHIGSSTAEACDRMAAKALDNVRFAQQRKFDQMNVLNREVLDAV